MRKKLDEDYKSNPEDDSFIYEEENMSSIYIDPACIADDTDPDFNDKYRFEDDFYINHKITELLKKKPPSGSVIKTEWKEYEGSSSCIPFAELSPQSHCLPTFTLWIEP